MSAEEIAVTNAGASAEARAVEGRKATRRDQPPLDPRRWPLTIKVPFLVAALVLAIGIVVSDRVLDRIAQSQISAVRTLTSAVLEDATTTVRAHLESGDLQGAARGLADSRDRFAGAGVVGMRLIDHNGHVVADVNPNTTASRPGGASQGGWMTSSAELAVDGITWMTGPVLVGGAPWGEVAVGFDLSGMEADRSAVLLVLVLANTVLTALVALSGYLFARRMLRPVGLLVDRFDRARNGQVDLIPEDELGDPKSEFGRLFRSFNEMATALAERDRLTRALADKERLASLGRLASGMAHEINNPLGGMVNTVDTLRRHGDDPEVRDQGLELLDRGLTGIRDVVRAALLMYRESGQNKSIQRSDLDDLRALVSHEAERRRVRLVWTNHLPAAVAVDGSAVRQVVLNLLLNAISATPAQRSVRLKAEREHGRMLIEISDDGPGMPEWARRRLEGNGDRLSASDGKGGLGLWIVAHLLGRLRATVRIENGQNGGSVVRIGVPLTSGNRD